MNITSKKNFNITYDSYGNPFKPADNHLRFHTKENLITTHLDSFPLNTPLIIWETTGEVGVFKNGHSIYQISPGFFEVFLSGKEAWLLHKSVVDLRHWMESMKTVISARQNSSNDITLELYEDVEADIQLCYSCFISANSWGELLQKINELYIEIKEEAMALFLAEGVF